MKKADFVVRFAGEGGQGMVTSAEGLAQAAAQVGYHVQTFSTFPSQIKGGPTLAQTRLSTEPILSSGDSLDVLVCFNKDAYEAHRGDVRPGGVVIYNSEDFDLSDAAQSFGMPFGEMARSTGNARAENMVVIGAFAHLVGMPQEYLEEFVRQRFSRGRAEDEQIIRANVLGLKLGRERAAQSGFSLGELPPPLPKSGKWVLVKGNEAISLGAMAGGVDAYIGYPISPATPILVFMERNLVGPGKFVYQASSEIEAFNAVIGAGFAGKKAMTATSGPGLSLMSEAIGMAWMAEVPCVLVNVQRGGPATGLPTKTEQSDLLAALHPAHGDAAMPVIAPGTVEECFYSMVHAFNWAERYQGPVVVLSEAILAERAQNIPRPDLKQLVLETRNVFQENTPYLRYEGAQGSPMPIPGGPGAYAANASEHDPYGDTTHLPERHVQMTERRFAKLRLLEDGAYERENPQAPVALLPWGGSKGPAQEAYEQLREEGQSLAWYYTMFIHPMPPRLVEELRQKDLVIVPELNYLGQLSSILRGMGIRAQSITQYTGLPFKVKDLVKRVREMAGAQSKRMVRV